MGAAFAAAMESSGGSNVLPPRPSREAVCAVRNQFQGISVGGRHLFEPEIGWTLTPEGRQRAYAAHRAVGDTHINLSLDLSGLACLPRLKAIIREAITAGAMTGVVLMCMGDGSPANPDPGALGVEWLMANFDAIVDYLEADEDLTPWIVFCPGYDGVVPGWQPWSRVNAFARMARARLDRLAHGGYLALELSSGYCVWSGEDNDWATTDGQCFDVILQEFPIEWGPPEAPPAYLLLPDGSDWAPSASNEQRAPWTQIWIVQRMLGPRYRRPAAQPPRYDPDPPYFLGGGTPRGRYFYIAWERTTYLWVRKNCDISIVNQQTAVVRDLGAEFY